MENRFPFNIENRFTHEKNVDGEIVNPYDIDSRLLDDMVKRGLGPVHVETINLGTANAGYFVNVAGRAFVLYGYASDSATKAVNTTIYVPAYIAQKGAIGPAFPAKHGRGFIGPFPWLTLAWASQKSAGVDIYADLIIFRGSDRPWIDGETCT